MPLFGASKKCPRKVVHKLNHAINTLAREDSHSLKAQRIVSKNLVHIKNMIFSTDVAGQNDDMVVIELAHQIYSTNALLLLIQNLHRIDFEGRKDVAQIFINVLIRRTGARSPTVEYICTKPEILFTLMAGYDHLSIIFHIGSMLRECTKYEELAKIMLHSDEFFNFFRYVAATAFDVASDAFLTFKTLLTSHNLMCAKFLEQNYDRVFDQYEQLLNSENYVTRRQSLQLLGQLLQNEHNYKVMLKYISKEENLKLIMNMLNDKSNYNQYEAFHIFKYFVANPDKKTKVRKILLLNQKKLIKFLSTFLAHRFNDGSFNLEKAYVIEKIKELQPEPEPESETDE
uniref:Uncharacterized protein n=1 Tax=Anopheles atroparvus TaxID=41427 RepID=A0A182IUK5_ANOAO